MSEQVKRYDVNTDGDDYEAMVLDSEGEYVLHTDLACVEQVNAELRAEVEAIKAERAEWKAKVRAEVDRLKVQFSETEGRAAIDALLHESAADEANDLRAKVARQTARVEALEKELRKWEWHGKLFNADGSVYAALCLVCGPNAKYPEHLPGCSLAAALSQPEAGT